MATAASTPTASRASSQHVAPPHDQQTTAGDVAPRAAVATPAARKQSRQPRKRPVAQAGKPAVIPRGDAGANPARPTTVSPTVKKHPGGRKSKYTPETVEKILQALRVGATHDLAQQYAGVSKSAFYAWMQDKPGFEAQVRQAEGEAAVSWLTVIETAATKNWQAAAWKLERRYPEMYGRTVQTHQGGQDIVITIAQRNTDITSQINTPRIEQRIVESIPA